MALGLTEAAPRRLQPLGPKVLACMPRRIAKGRYWAVKGPKGRPPDKNKF